jgi:hypothetical protein
MRRAGQEPGRAAPRAAGAGSGDGAAAERAVQAARGPVNGAADGGRKAADFRGARGRWRDWRAQRRLEVL